MSTPAKPDAMFYETAPYVLSPTSSPAIVADRLLWVSQVGQKGAGLRLLPQAWTPPYVAISSTLYVDYVRLGGRRKSETLFKVSTDISEIVSSWATHWQTGILIRSSAVDETLAERGLNETHTLAADYARDHLIEAIESVFSNFSASNPSAAMALIVQARVPIIALGHMSNERRVSKTINQWMWELEGVSPIGGRFNSQRERLPSLERNLSLDSFHNEDLMRRLKQVGLWSTGLSLGPCHLEWGASKDAVWVLQLDVEDDQPDPGCDPNLLLVPDEGEYEVGQVPAGSPFKLANLGDDTGWRKLDKVRDLISGEDESYPELLWLTGEEFLASDSSRALAPDLERFSKGRIVVRTDCRDNRVSSLNLPRTDSVSAGEAISFMRLTLFSLSEGGTAPADVAFIIHRFIPAGAAAWVLADPDRQIVLVDSLWGLPDGLQYLPHDTFQYDVRQTRISAEKRRYKPAFLQETPTGTWCTIRVKRDLARHRSLSSSDVAEIARRTHAIASKLGKPIQVMWFCRIPEFLKIGRNIPWFSLPPESHKEKGASATPGKSTIRIRNFPDLEAAQASQVEDATMIIEPSEAELYRNNDFLERIASVAQTKGYSVSLSGSTLSHAFYLLERRNISVIQIDSIKRTRARNRRVFKKLVRDEIPMRIVSQGENVTLAEVAAHESRLALVTKLFEEAHELIYASERGDVVAELSDLYEIVRALCVVTGTSLAEVEEAADEKRAKRGGFEKNIVLVQTSWPALDGKAGSSGSETVNLADLVEVRNSGPDHHVTYPGLVGPRASTKIRLEDGRIIIARLDGSGLLITEMQGESDQPSLPLTTE